MGARLGGAAYDAVFSTVVLASQVEFIHLEVVVVAVEAANV